MGLLCGVPVKTKIVLTIPLEPEPWCIFIGNIPPFLVNASREVILDLWVQLLRLRFLNLNTIDIWDWIILCCGRLSCVL